MYLLLSGGLQSRKSHVFALKRPLGVLKANKFWISAFLFVLKMSFLLKSKSKHCLYILHPFELLPDWNGTQHFLFSLKLFFSSYLLVRFCIFQVVKLFSQIVKSLTPPPVLPLELCSKGRVFFIWYLC